MKILEWNIHGAAGYGNYSIPEFIAGEIIKQVVDIVVLTEFVMGNGWDYLNSVLEKEYRLFYTPYISNNNGILIAIKKDFKNLDINSARVSEKLNTTLIETPNFLQVEIKETQHNQSIFIIGTRIRDTIIHLSQFNALKEHLESLPVDSKVLGAGDFNEWRSSVAKKLGEKITVYTPYFKMSPNNFDTLSTWSAILKDKKTGKIGKALIDHIVAKNVKVTDVKYSWDFVNSCNGYYNIRPEDYKSNMICYPDHAILTATFEF